MKCGSCPRYTADRSQPLNNDYMNGSGIGAMSHTRDPYEGSPRRRRFTTNSENSVEYDPPNNAASSEVGKKMFEMYVSKQCTYTGVLNISQELYGPIKEIRNMSDITIKRSDKAVKFDVYEPTSHAALILALESVENLIDKFISLKVINPIDAQKITLGTAKPGRFYMLPKTHKKVSPTPKRPIVSACETATEQLSKYIDLLLKPLLKRVYSHLHSTDHFLEQLDSVRRTSCEFQKSGPLDFEFNSGITADFLDVHLYLNDRGYLQYKLYRKDTFVPTFIHADSYHSSAVKRNTVSNEIKRIIGRWSESGKRYKHMLNFKNMLMHRGYSKSWINKVMRQNLRNSTNYRKLKWNRQPS
ncbi:hypothetical protein GJ496_008190 [Pomphorhynchus laevis]|nr:hypothetical protein GJ496_008190 [Pomphorhynchus laevis]